MNVKDLLRGIVVVVDDQIGEDSSEISQILTNFENDNFPIVKYKTIPSIEVIDSLSSASIIILDWDFKPNVEIEREPGEPIIVPDGTSLDVLPLLNKLLEKLFVPIFIFTNQDLDGVISKLNDKNLGSQINKRIFIKNKNDLEGEKLYTEIENWLKNNPSAYVVKEWDKIAIENRNNMFLDFYNSEADWVPILWKALADDSDSLNTPNELGEFITKNFCNRFHSYNFEETYTKKEIENIDGLFNVLKYDAYIQYNVNKLPNIAYTGDVFKINDDYYINLRAQCDISRKDSNSDEYNPFLYCIKGKAESNNKVIRDYISIIKDTNEEIKIVLGEDEPLPIDSSNCDVINKKIKKCINNNFYFKYGALLERKDSILFPYIKENKVFKFNINKIEIKNFSEIKDKRIGRIVPPYLTRIQQKTANYITRQGLMPIPEEMYFG